MENLTTYYNKLIETGELLPDEKQSKAVQYLQVIQNNIHQSNCLKKTGLQKWFHLKTPATINGAFLYGGVGGGKSLLMDMFYKTLDCPNKYRVHYHSFMEWTHHTLAVQIHNKNPVDVLANNLAKKAHIICIDEFHVNNITDAMIMKGLLEALYKKQILVVYTSNRPPIELYYNGLQRESFLPAIKLIQQHNITLDLKNDTDYRQKQTKQKNIFKVATGDSEKEFMQTWLQKLSLKATVSVDPLLVSGRQWKIYGQAPTLLWLDFEECCVEYRSREDYIQLTQQFDIILLSNIKRMDDESNDQARRFTNFIDAIYDAHVHLIATAEVPFNCLYQGEFLAFVFERTSSRLIEMQSKNYWLSKHKHRN